MIRVWETENAHRIFIAVFQDGISSWATLIIKSTRCTDF